MTKSESGDADPDWLREFKAPSNSILSLSSDSDSSPENSPVRSARTRKVELKSVKKEEVPISIDSGEESPRDSDDEKPRFDEFRADEYNLSQELGSFDASEEQHVDEDTQEKPAELPVSGRLPFVFPEKVQRTKALVECDGESIDLSGDVGAVGRIVISDDPNGNNNMLLDLKGTIYKTTIVPSRTFCVVNIGQSEAKIEAIMNDFIQLEPLSNVFEAETMIEGTLEGFTFDSDDEADKVPNLTANQRDQKNKTEDADSKTKRKLDKSSGTANKKAKPAAKPAKKGVRKPQVQKMPKKSKK